MKKIIFMFIVCTFLVTPCLAESEVYEFVNDYIDGLQLLAINVERANMLTSENYSSDMEMAISLLSEGRRAKDRLADAKRIMLNYKNSSNSLIAEASNLIAIAYTIHIDINDRQLELHEKLFENKEGLDEGQYVVEASKIQADSDRAWEMLNQCSVLVTHCLVDKNPDEEGHLSYLVLTSEERQKLIDRLVSIYGEPIRDGMQGGQTSFKLCGTILYQVLAGEHKSADER